MWPEKVHVLQLSGNIAQLLWLTYLVTLKGYQETQRSLIADLSSYWIT